MPNLKFVSFLFRNENVTLLSTVPDKVPDKRRAGLMSLCRTLPCCFTKTCSPLELNLGLVITKPMPAAMTESHQTNDASQYADIGSRIKDQGH